VTVEAIIRAAANAEKAQRWCWARQAAMGADATAPGLRLPHGAAARADHRARQARDPAMVERLKFIASRVL
jgi:hypothetical protein